MTLQRRGSPGGACLGAIALAATLAACGEPLLSASAYDSPMFALHGIIASMVTDLPVLKREVAVLWIDPLQQSVRDIPSSPRTVRMTLVENTFTLQMFAPPSPDTAVDLIDAVAQRTLARFSFGEIVLVDDVSGDGTFALTDRDEGSQMVLPDHYRGGGLLFFVMYIWQPMTDADAIITAIGTAFTGEVGYHLGYVSSCNMPDIAQLAVVDPILTSLTITVAAQTQELPNERGCLRSVPLQP